MKARLLIVDDEPALCEMLADSFRLADYEVETASDGLSALRILDHEKFDLVITDVSMPNLDGIGLVQKLRENNGGQPVIVLSAKNSKPEINTALRIGADDYVSKPFGLEELSLRVAAVLRRTMKKDDSVLLRCGPITLDDPRHEVKLEDKIIDLSPTEFALLRALMLKAGRVLTKSELMRQVWNITFQADTNVLGTYISYLRKKLHTEKWQGIKTIRGLGFQIDAD